MKQTTDKQAKALKLIREGEKPTVAMRMAGYSSKTSEAPSQNLLRSAGAKSIIEQFQEEYYRVGITPSYLVEKTKQWLEAKKPIGAKILVNKDGKLISADDEGAIEVDDFITQIKAAEFVRKDLGLISEQNQINQTNIQVIVTRGEEEDVN